MSNYLNEIYKSRQLWTRGAPSLRLLRELISQFPEVAPSKVEDDFFEAMGDYPDGVNDAGEGAYE